jgi:Ino eighty subunit 2
VIGSDEEEPLDDGPDELDVLSYAGSSRRSISPSKLTARQRAKGNKDLQDTLIALPNGALPPHPFHWARLMGEVDTQGKKLVLTEAERLQRREETARRRKRQSEQRLQDEQVGDASSLSPSYPPPHTRFHRPHQLSIYFTSKQV